MLEVNKQLKGSFDNEDDNSPSNSIISLMTN